MYQSLHLEAGQAVVFNSRMIHASGHKYHGVE
jgi:ectoine hydroxylase-related dioxygenase (phytanoyl-CoA dioxygenase family)